MKTFVAQFTWIFVGQFDSFFVGQFDSILGKIDSFLWVNLARLFVGQFDSIIMGRFVSIFVSQSNQVFRKLIKVTHRNWVKIWACPRLIYGVTLIQKNVSIPVTLMLSIFLKYFPNVIRMPYLILSFDKRVFSSNEIRALTSHNKNHRNCRLFNLFGGGI